MYIVKYIMLYTIFVLFATEKKPRRAWSQVAHRAVGRESTGKQRQTERNGHHDPETLPPPHQKKNDENTVTGLCPRGVSPKKCWERGGAAAATQGPAEQ